MRRHVTVVYVWAMTSSNGNIFRVTGPLCGEFTGHRWIPQRPATQSFDVFFDLCLNKRLSRQSWGWRFETPSRSLWRHCDVFTVALSCTAAWIVVNIVVHIDYWNLNISIEPYASGWSYWHWSSRLTGPVLRKIDRHQTTQKHKNHVPSCIVYDLQQNTPDVM